MKKIFMVLIILTTIIPTASCFSSKTNNNNDGENNKPLRVSIIQLIANPAEYHGKKIWITGVADLQYAGFSIYLNQEAWYWLSEEVLWVNNCEIIDNKIWFHINGKLISEEVAKEYNGKYVFIEGTFDMYIKGHRGRFSGGIDNVTRFEDRSDSHRGAWSVPATTVAE